MELPHVGFQGDLSHPEDPSISFGLWALESLKELRESESTADQTAVSAQMSTQFWEMQADVQQGTHLSSWDGISLNVENFAL